MNDDLPRDRAGAGRYEGYARPGEVNVWLAGGVDFVEYPYLVEQTHAIDLNLAERPELVTEKRHLPAPDFGMTDREKRELGKAVRKLERTR